MIMSIVHLSHTFIALDISKLFLIINYVIICNIDIIDFYWLCIRLRMVCVPCIVIPVLLYIWHRFLQPIFLKFWNPWAKVRFLKRLLISQHTPSPLLQVETDKKSGGSPVLPPGHTDAVEKANGTSSCPFSGKSNTEETKKTSWAFYMLILSCLNCEHYCQWRLLRN